MFPKFHFGREEDEILNKKKQAELSALWSFRSLSNLPYNKHVYFSCQKLRVLAWQRFRHSNDSEMRSGAKLQVDHILRTKFMDVLRGICAITAKLNCERRFSVCVSAQIEA